MNSRCCVGGEVQYIFCVAGFGCSKGIHTVVSVSRCSTCICVAVSVASEFTLLRWWRGVVRVFASLCQCLG